MPRVAFYTFGLLREQWGHPQVRGLERAGPILGRAMEAPGFLSWFR